MARIEGVDLPNNKRVLIALTYIYGIGLSVSKKILSKLSIDESKRVSDLTESDVSNIKTIIEKDYQVEGELRSKISLDIKRLMDVATYRGLRHRKGLPVRGQKTKTNARTRKGHKGRIAKKK